MFCGRSKSGITTYKVVDKNTGESTPINLDDYLSKKQKRIASTKPDVIWQFAQRLKQIYAEKGRDVSVFVNSRVSVNGNRYKQFINPEIDLANVKWDAFRHHDWILPSE